MLHSVALIIVDIVKSRTIHAKLREEIGSKADTQYTRTIYAPFRQRVDELLKSHDGRIDNDTGDQVAAFFDHAHDAIAFALALQRRMLAEPIAVPDGCGSPRLQLHIAVGYGTMDPEAYQKPGTVRVGAFNDLARILAVTADDQILVTPEARATAGKFTDITWHDWDVVLPKEQDKARVLEMLWDGRAPQRPKDMASVSSQAIALVAQNKKLQDENVSLKADLTAALERMQALADTGDPQAAAAIEQARATGDLTQLDAALDAEWARREAQLKDQFRDMLELSRQSAAVAYLHGDIDKAMLRAQTILRIAPDDLDAINLIGRIHNLRGDLPTAQKQFERELALAGEDPARRSRPLGGLGGIASTRGDMAGAEKLHRESLEIDRTLGRLEGQAKQLSSLGIIAAIRRNHEEAEQRFRESLAIDRTLGRLEGQGGTLNNLGNIAQARGDLHDAEKLYRQALEIFRKLGKLEWEANALGNLGNIANNRGELAEAEKFMRESLEIDRKLGRLEGQASTLGSLSDVSRDKGDLTDAHQLAESALELARQCGNVYLEAASLESLGKTAQRRGDAAEARRLLGQSRDLFARIGREPEAKRLQGLLDALPAE